MKNVVGLGVVLLSMGLGSAAHAKAITVWVYGDGQSTRMFSELGAHPATGITVVPKAQNSTGPEGLANRIYADLV